MKTKLTLDWHRTEIEKMDLQEWHNEDMFLFQSIEKLAQEPEIKELEGITQILNYTKSLKENYSGMSAKQKIGLSVFIKGLYQYQRMWYFDIFMDIYSL